MSKKSDVQKKPVTQIETQEDRYVRMQHDENWVSKNLEGKTPKEREDLLRRTEDKEYGDNDKNPLFDGVKNSAYSTITGGTRKLEEYKIDMQENYFSDDKEKQDINNQQEQESKGFDVLNKELDKILNQNLDSMTPEQREVFNNIVGSDSSKNKKEEISGENQVQQNQGESEKTPKKSFFQKVKQWLKGAEPKNKELKIHKENKSQNRSRVGVVKREHNDNDLEKFSFFNGLDERKSKEKDMLDVIEKDEVITIPQNRKVVQLDGKDINKLLSKEIDIQNSQGQNYTAHINVPKGYSLNNNNERSDSMSSNDSQRSDSIVPIDHKKMEAQNFGPSKVSPPPVRVSPSVQGKGNGPGSRQ